MTVLGLWAALFPVNLPIAKNSLVLLLCNVRLLYSVISMSQHISFFNLKVPTQTVGRQGDCGTRALVSLSQLLPYE